MKYFLILFINFLFVTLTAQKSNSIQFFGSPFIQQIGNLNNQYTSVSNEFIEVDYIKTPSQEVGLGFHHNFKGKWGWGIGASWRNATYLTYINFRHPSWSGKVVFTDYRKNYIQAINLRFSASYKISEHIRLYGFINLGSPFTNSMNNHWADEFGIGSAQQFHYDCKIIENRLVPNYRLVPEFRVDFEIIKNLNFTLGLRWKFWTLPYDYEIKIEVNGYAGEENYGTYETIHSYKADGREISYYFGLMYDLPFKKNKNLLEVEP
jgi:outer membrane receptor protein involved in Fe transport